MTTKNIIYGVLIVIIIAIAGLWTWNNQTEKVDCFNIVSSKSIEKCIGKEIKAIGVFRQIPSGMKGVGNLNFDDGTTIQFLGATNLKAEYDNNKIGVQGKLHKCGDLDQCAGIGISDIKSVILISGNVPVGTDTKQVQCDIDKSGSAVSIEYGVKKYRYFKKVVAEVEFKDYNNFSLKKLTYGYGSGPNLWAWDPLGLKMKSQTGEILANLSYADPREDVVLCEQGAQCPPPKFLKDGEHSFIFSLFGPYSQKDVGNNIDTRTTGIIELYEREKLPNFINSFSGYTPGKLLLKIDLKDCLENFCENVAESGDSACSK